MAPRTKFLTLSCEARAERPGRALDGQILQCEAREDRSVPAVDLAIPAFGYKNHVSIDRGFGLIRFPSALATASTNAVAT